MRGGQFIVLVVVSTLVEKSGAAEPDHIPGHYALQKNPDPAYWKVIKAAGVPDSKIEQIRRNNFRMKIRRDGKKLQVEVQFSAGQPDGKVARFTLEPGKETEQTWINGKKNKVKVKIEGNRVIVTRKFPDFEMLVTRDFSLDGFESILLAKGLKGRAKWGRLTPKIVESGRAIL